MSLSARRYIVSDLPDVRGAKAEKLAAELYDEWFYYKESSSELREVIWPACDAAFHCRFENPTADGMDWADQSNRGITDVRDATRALAQSMALGLLPRDDTAFQVISRKAEEQAESNDIRDLILDLCKRCDLRGKYEQHLLQMLLRGTSLLWVNWKRKENFIRMSDDEAIAMVIEENDQNYLALQDPAARKRYLRQMKKAVLKYNGPEVNVLDMSDVYLDPAAGWAPDGELPPMAIMTYRTLDDLADEVDETGERVYDDKTLEGLSEMSMESLAQLSELKSDALEHVGINHMAGGKGQKKFVPVLVFHRSVRKFETEKYVDTFFEMALTGPTAGKLIRAYENPNPNGCIFLDTFEDWISGTPYGTGIVEHALPSYQYKNVIERLTLNAQLSTVFPAVAVVADVLTDERTVKLGSGAVNTIKYKAGIGLNFMQPILTGANSQMGMMASQWFGQKVLSASGVYGAVQQDPTKNIKEAKTATQVNVETTSGSVMRDNLLERMTTRSLEPIVNRIYEYARMYLEDGAAFDRPYARGSSVTQGTMPKEVLNKDRKIVVVGYHGMLNKSREIEELREVMAVLTQGNILEMMPTMVPVVQETLFKLLGRLGVRNLEEYKKEPAELLASTPAGQQILQQAQQEGYQMALQEMGVEMPPMEGEGMPPEMMPEQGGEDVPLGEFEDQPVPFAA